MRAACVALAVIAAGALVLSLGMGTKEPSVGPSLPGDSSNYGIELPHPITGKCYDSEGGLLVGIEVTVTDVTLGASGVAEWDGDMYSYDIANLPGEWAPGDEVLVEAVWGSFSGSNTTIATDGWFDVVDVHVDTTGIPEFPMVLMPVLGILALFAIARIRGGRSEA
jgi:hypothetical protein